MEEEKREKGGSLVAGQPKLGPEVGRQHQDGSPTSIVGGGKVADDG